MFHDVTMIMIDHYVVFFILWHPTANVHADLHCMVILTGTASLNENWL